MAAGQGTRMGPLTRNRPKVLLPVAGAPLVEHMVRRGKQAGFTRIMLIVHAFEQQVRDHFASTGLDVDFVSQGEAGGTGHAVAALDGTVDGPFVLVSGDCLLSVEDLQTLRSSPCVGGHEVADIRPYGRLDVQDGQVVGIAEKPPEAAPGTANAGCYHFPETIIEACKVLAPSQRGELELTDAVTTTGPYPLVDLPSWAEAGRPWELLDLQALVAAPEGDPLPSGVHGPGPASIHPDATVLPGVRIEGPVWIGPGAKVGPNAYLRGPVHIGAGCHIGAGVEIKNSIIGDHSNVPHLSYVGDSVLGRDCNLGAGTQVANLKVNDRGVRVKWDDPQWLDTGRRKLGTVMGDGVKTGVNCSINPGTVFEAGARVGAGRVLSEWIRGQD